MTDDSIHKPQLPGVRTLSDDAASSKEEKDDLGVTFLGGSGKKGMHAPEATVGEIADSKEAGGSTLSGSGDLFNVSRAFEGEGHDVGTIVTDRRQRDTSMTGILSAAFTEWWGKTRVSLDRVSDKIKTFAPEEPPTVASPESRKEIIQEAVQFTKQAPRDDHRVVVEKLKTLSRDAEQVSGKPFIIQQEVRPSAPTWSHEKSVSKKTTNDVASIVPPQKQVDPVPTLDLRETAIAPTVGIRITKKPDDFIEKTTRVVEQAQKDADQPLVVKHQIVRPIRHTEAILKDTTVSVAPEVKRHEDKRQEQLPSVLKPTQPPRLKLKDKETEKELSHTGWSFFKEDTRSKIPETAPIPSNEEISKYETLSKPEPKREPVIRPTVTPLAREMIDSPAPDTPLRFSEAPLTRQVQKPLVRSLPQQTNNGRPVAKIALFVFVIVLAAMLGVGAGIYTISHMDTKNESATEEPVTINIPSFFTTSTQIAIPISDSRETLLTKLSNGLKEAPSGVTQFYPVRGELGASYPATTEDIIGVLAIQAPGSFKRSLNETMMVGSVTVTENEPFMILRSNSFDVAFAGMLEWERTMSNDLSPFFGEPVKETLLPLSPESKARPAFFTDALRDNRSIRILYDENANERIIYAFVNRSTIIITTSTNALAEILRNLK